jgi:hypothetical protein
MTRKNPSVNPVSTKPAAAATTSTPVRNSPIPKVPAAAPAAPRARQVTHEQIAARAYEISRSGTGGSEFDNWVRAERELRGA